MVNQTFTFSSTTTSHNFIMTIIDDSIAEINEEFSASITTPQYDIKLSPSSARVLILNDDCVYLCVYVCVFV